jgi:hypothetical protein
MESPLLFTALKNSDKVCSAEDSLFQLWHLEPAYKVAYVCMWFNFNLVCYAHHTVLVEINVFVPTLVCMCSELCSECGWDLWEHKK